MTIYGSDNNWELFQWINKKHIKKKRALCSSFFLISNSAITLSFNYGVPLFDVFKEKRGKGDNEEIPGFIHPIITTKTGKRIHGLEDDILNFKKFCHRRKLTYCILKGFQY